MKNTLILLVMMALFSFSAIGQETTENSVGRGLPRPSDYDRLSAGVNFGLCHLFSDVLFGSGGNNNRYLQQGLFKPVIGLNVHYQLSHSIGLRARGLSTSFAGYDVEKLPDDTGKVRLTGIKFSSPVKEGSLELTYNFGNISFLNRNKNFHFVTTLGIGLFNFSTEVKRDSADDKLIRTSGNISEIMIPMSFGFKYNVNKVSVGVAFEYRKTFSDNVDATEKEFSETDNYAMVNLGINYSIGKKNKPMEWVNPLEVVYNDLADMKEKVDIISGDKDNDGISDLFDKDNNTPQGSKVYGDGTAVDTDGDGIIDMNDADPFSPKGSQVDANGQEIDTDADGVPDSRDLEPNTSPGTVVNFQGLSIAKPGEFAANGGLNGRDGTSGTSGVSGTGYLPSVFFDLGSSQVKAVYHDRLLTIARALKANPNANLRITGNCDVSGGSDENMKLGQRRAEGVKEHLVKQYGINSSRIRTESKGKNEPEATGLNAMNRRVDFSLE